MSDTAPAPTVWPSLSFTDVDAAVALLTDGLGFEITALYRDDAGVVHHAEARRPDGGGIMFGSRDREASDWAKLGAQGVYIVAAEAATVDTMWKRLQDWPGVTVTLPLEDTDYGSHTFGIRDADGNLYSIGTYRGA